MSDDQIVPMPNVALVKASEVPALLALIRPQWQAKRLIDRVRVLLQTDPSSACQRILNAAFHDLREKVVIAGIDVAEEAAKQHKLPPVNKPEDVEAYSASKLIDLAYRMGLLSRPEWRRLSRCYEIRRDLEHEDDEYEAGVEDCIYIFKTCIEVVLARDPVRPLRIADVKDVVDQPGAIVPDQALLEDYERAPQARQEEICKFLVSLALNEGQPEVVQQNALALLAWVEPLSSNQTKLALVPSFQDSVQRSGLDRRLARVAVAIGVLPYLRKADRLSFFEGVLRQMEKVGVRWKAYTEHGELLRSFREIGGFRHVPEELRSKFVVWCVLTYIGEPGGMTRFGHVRPVFYSNTAAPLIREILQEDRRLVGAQVEAVKSERTVKMLLSDAHIAARYEDLLDVVQTGDA